MCERILGVGVDLCDIARIERAMAKPRFLTRFYTDAERTYIEARGQGAAQSAAAMFAAKEAAAKALGTGFAGGVMPEQIEVIHAENGAPSLALHGAAAERMRAVGGIRFHLSLSHEQSTAIAFAVLVGEAREEG